ncbi:MAG: 16S rRNA (cytidine(1402)-2'-O)-methyltransferase [Bryobacteraceae bacterium]
MTGKLYLVATPIGNLEDITFRAVRVLKEADLIACEDTRHTRGLLDHHGIDRPTISYHDHNEAGRTPELIDRLKNGQSIAIVSDAGTPLISDPGYRLVHQALAEGIPVVPIPGPSAILAALTASGLPTDAFHFGGFLPAKTSQRRKALEAVRGMTCSLVFYETPHRILEALEDVTAVLGARPVVLTRELTKMHEEFLRGTAAEVLAKLRERPSIKGEMTLVIGKPVAVEASGVPIADAVNALIDGGMPRMDAMKAIARERGLSKREVYAAVEGSDCTAPSTDR